MFMVVLLHFDSSIEHKAWRILGKSRFHTKTICDVMFISSTTSSTHASSQHHHKVIPRLISLAEDRVSFQFSTFFLSFIQQTDEKTSENLFPLYFAFRLCSNWQQIVEYDLVESMKENRGLAISFVKRIFQTALPVSMTLIHNSRQSDEQLLIADTNMKFKLFDKNTFEILATFLGPIYDSYVKQLVWNHLWNLGEAQMDFLLECRVKGSIKRSFSPITHPISCFFISTQDANFMLAPTVRSKFFVFATSRNICLHAMPIDGNPFKSLAILGHCNGVKSIKVDATRQILFTIGHKCQTLFMWSINYR